MNNFLFSLRGRLAHKLVSWAFSIHHDSAKEQCRRKMGVGEFLKMRKNAKRRAYWLCGHTHRFEPNS